MKECHETNKDKISTDATFYSEEHDRAEYHQFYYASNLKLSLGYLLTSDTTKPLGEEP